jgi:tetratricopeptide (TPR) repeat protein
VCLERDGEDEARLSLLLLGESRLGWLDGRYDDAVALGKRSVEIRERTLPPEHPDIASSLNTLGIAAMDGGDLEAALAYHRRALAIRRAAFGATHPLVASSMGNMAIVLWAQGDLPAAIEAYRGALAIHIGAYGPDDRVVAWTLENLGLAYSDAGDQTSALEVIHRAIDILDKDPGDAALAYANLAEPLLALHRWDEAIAMATRRLEYQERTYGSSYPLLAVPLGLVGRGLAGKRRYPQAVATLERALRLAETPGFSPARLAHARLDLARVLRDSHGDAARAAALAEQARAELVKEGAKLELARLEADFPAVPLN